MTELSKPVIHIGCMRTGSTFLQKYFAECAHVDLRLKTRFFSYEPYWLKQHAFFKEEPSKNLLLIDSDENYSLGRFKSALIHHTDYDFNVKKEVSLISHKIERMAQRIHQIYPNGKIVMVIRNQTEWIESVYMHDILHFGLDKDFSKFLKSDLGISYSRAADYHNLYETYSMLFGEANVKILFFEQLKMDSESFFDDLSAFIGIKLVAPASDKVNKSMETNVIAALRLINRLSQSNPLKKERRRYFLAKNLLFKTQAIIRHLPLPKLISKNLITEFALRYKDSNAALAQKLNKEEDMKKYGFNL